MVLFGAAHGWEGKRSPLPKICQTYPAVMKLDTVIPYLKIYIYISKNYMNDMTYPLSFASISIFSAEISMFCYIKKYRYRLHFDT